MQRFLQRLLCAFALLAMAGAQIVGIHRSYVCEVNGVAIETAADHCHDGESLVADHLPDYAAHQQGEHEEGTTRHAPLKIDLSASQSPTVVFAPLAANLLAALPEFLAPLLPVAASETGIAPPADPGGKPPPASLLVAESIVLLV